MWNTDYVDEYVAEECKRNFRVIYPESQNCIILGVSQDKMTLLAEVEFSDGTFYFRLTPESISQAYRSLDDADRVWENGDPIR